MQPRAGFTDEVAPAGQPHPSQSAAMARSKASLLHGSGSHLPVPDWHNQARNNLATHNLATHNLARHSHESLHAELPKHERQLWDGIPLGLIVVDRSLRVLEANEPARVWLDLARRDGSRLHLGELGFGELCVGELVDDTTTDQLAEMVGAAFSGAVLDPLVICVRDERMPEANRYLRWSIVSVTEQSIALCVEDVSEFQRLQQEKQQAQLRLEQLQRLELVHTISAGIAHDFKNIVQVIESYAAILNGQTLASSQNNAIPIEIMAAASRGAMLANRWLAYSRYGQLQKQAVEVTGFWRQCMERICQTMSSAVQVELTAGMEVTSCLLDPCLIEQVLFNLCLNARDAMPTGGRLEVSIDKVAFDTQASSHDLLPAGQYVRCMVADSGMGIAPENLKRIFEPFFTTKESCAGTGLGLSLVRSVISEHQGAIEVWSKVGSGSRFTFYLPLGSD